MGSAISGLPSPATGLASWSIGSVRYFACDGVAGDDSRNGYSDVSQAAAGLVAVRTLSRLLEIVPRDGNGRIARAAVLSTDYPSDATLSLSHHGYAQLTITATATVASAGATAFAGGTADTIAAGMVTATGMNAAGYKATAGASVLLLPCTKADGSAPGFGAAPNRPYGCRVRFDAATATVALRNFCSGVLLATGGDTLKLSYPLAAIPTVDDVFYVEMPGVTGPTKTVLMAFGGDGNGNPCAQLTGLSLGAIQSSLSRCRLSACEATNVIGDNNSFFIDSQSFDGTFKRVGLGLRCNFFSMRGSDLTAKDVMTTSTATMNTFFAPAGFVLERIACGSGMALYGGAHAVGNSIVETVGTNAAAAHGGDCEFWGVASSPPQGTPACGLFLGGGYTLGRIRFSNMGANPMIRVAAACVGFYVYGIAGGAADGNLDVALSLSALGVEGNGAQGCVVSLLTAPVATGTLGDVRLSSGEIVTWASLVAVPQTDKAGNRFVTTGGNGSAVAAANGSVAVSLGSTGPAGSNATPVRYVRIPDGTGGFFTVPSFT